MREVSHRSLPGDDSSMMDVICSVQTIHDEQIAKDSVKVKPLVKPRKEMNSDSSYSIDILSGGESETDSLWRKNDDSLKLATRRGDVVSKNTTGTGTFDTRSNKPTTQGDAAFYIAKEILMTERTYKKDLEVISVWLRGVIPSKLEIELCGGPIWTPLDCILSVQGPVLKSLELKLGARPGDIRNGNCAESTGTIMYNYLEESLSLYEKWISDHLDCLKRLEAACCNSPALERACRDVEQCQRACYLPLNSFLLKPLYRLLHLHKIFQFAVLECKQDKDLGGLEDCLRLITPLCQEVNRMLPESLNFSYLCSLRRDIEGVENLVQPDRHFLRQGCLYKHSNKGPQQRMFFLFSDVLMYTSKSHSPQQQFRIHGIIPLSSITVDLSEFNNSFTIYGSGKAMTISASCALDRDAWLEDINSAVHLLKSEDSDKSPSRASSEKAASTSSSAEDLYESNENSSLTVQRSNTLSHVCWHRNASLSWSHLYLGMQNQLSGYLLRKFKNSLGWQKLWVVFASFCLYFYKTCQDDHPLASLPLLGYTVTTPSEKDAINKDYVFKLVFKNHIYFFRAESDYTFKRWMEVISSAAVQRDIPNNNHMLVW